MSMFYGLYRVSKGMAIKVVGRGKGTVEIEVPVSSRLPFQIEYRDKDGNMKKTWNDLSYLTFTVPSKGDSDYEAPECVKEGGWFQANGYTYTIYKDGQRFRSFFVSNAGIVFPSFQEDTSVSESRPAVNVDSSKRKDTPRVVDIPVLMDENTEIPF